MEWEYGIDLGSENARVAELVRGPIIDTAAVMAYHRGSDAAFAAGDTARRLIGRAYDGVVVRRPITDGSLENNLQLEKILRWLEREAGAREIPGKRFTLALLCSPFARQVQMDAMLAACLDSGAGDAALIRSDYAAAAGAEMDLIAPEAKFVIDLGAGKVTATLITMGRVAAFGFIPYGMARLDESIAREVRIRYGHAIGIPTAAELKHALASAAVETAPRHIHMRVAGINLVTRQPDMFDVEADGVVDIAGTFVREIARLCLQTMADAPEELCADLSDAGAVLTGGGAMLPGLDVRLSQELGIPVKTAVAPALAPIRGLHRIMREPEKFGDAELCRLSRSSWR